MKDFITSTESTGLRMHIENGILFFDYLPLNDIFNKITLRILDKKRFIFEKKFTSRPISIAMPKLRNGIYGIEIYCKSPFDTPNDCVLDSKYCRIKVLDNKYEFVDSVIRGLNYEFLREYNLRPGVWESFANKPSFHINSTNKDVVDLAKSLCKDSVSEWQKVKRIYEYVTGTVHYDVDAFTTRECDEHEYTSDEVFKTLRCVCRGFVNLTGAMLRAINIPCITIGVNTDGAKNGWEDEASLKSDADHIIIAAWITTTNGTKRWLIMDPTWDSDRSFTDSVYKSEGIKKLYPYKYFDCTIDFISHTHRFVRVPNIY